MSQPHSSGPSRTLAATALVGGFVVLLVVIAASLGGGDGNGGGSGTKRGKVSRTAERRAPAAYVVESGDTLTSIARKTGVSVDRIERLNPGVDPQILVSGEKLKLRVTR